MNTTLRDATVADTPAVVALIHELAESGGEHSPLTPEFAASYLGNPASRILLAEVDGQVVGLLSYSIRPDLYHAGHTALIEELVVRGALARAGHRRRAGAGTARPPGSAGLRRSLGLDHAGQRRRPPLLPRQRVYRRGGVPGEALRPRPDRDAVATYQTQET